MGVRNRFSAEKVTVATGSRLHLGFYAFEDRERLFGGLGLAISRPTYILTAVATEDGGIIVEGCQSERVRSIVERAFRDLNPAVPGLRVEVTSCIPEHTGLGSTTQLSLAVYTSISILNGSRLDVYELAKLSGRGSVSGIGVAAFKYGGLIVDAGKPRYASENYVVKPLVRLPFPKEWTPVIVLPRTRWKVTEKDEPNLFRKAGGLGERDRSTLLTLVFRKLLPAVIDRDFASFASALEKVQELTGLYFYGAQEGIYCCSEAERAVEALKALGARGVGQSSWGPLVYGFYPAREKAARAAKALPLLLRQEGVETVLVEVVRPRNSGARILVS